MSYRFLVLPILFWHVFVLSDSVLAQESYEPNVATTRKAIISGRVKEALAAYESQAREAEERAKATDSPQRYWELAVLNYAEAARAARLTDQLQKAIAYGEKALEIAKKTSDVRLKLRGIYQGIMTYRRVGNFDKVQNFISDGFAILEDEPQASQRRLSMESQLYDALGVELLRARRYEDAIAASTRSVVLNEFYLDTLLNETQPDQTAIRIGRGDAIFRLYNLAEAYRAAGRLYEAKETIMKAFAWTEKWNIVHNFENNLNLALGEIYLQQKDFLSAIDHFERALRAMEKQQTTMPPPLLPSVRLGDALLQGGKPEAAVTYYRKAVEQIESTRSLLHLNQLRQSFFESGLNAYVGMINALFAGNDVRGAFDYNERARSRGFLDMLGNKIRLSKAKSSWRETEQAVQASIANVRTTVTEEAAGGALRVEDLREAETKYNTLVARIRIDDKEQASLMNVEPARLTEVQKSLDPGQVLVEYFIGPEKTFVWVVRSDRMKAATISVSRASLASKIDKLRRSIAEIGPLNQFQIASRELYNLLFAPISSYVGVKEIILVPHGPLHYLPFQALYSPRGRYLIEDYSLTYLSSASLLQFTKEKRTSRRRKILAFGDPDLGNTRERLNFCDMEIKEIQKVYPESVVFSRKDASEAKGKALSSQYDILHFATHAELDEKDPLSSRIFLTPSDQEDGRLEVREIFEMELNANLVVLSACDTALGKLSSGDELVGLTRAFIYAGTPSVIASLWKVDDSSTAHLMSSFYRNLKSKTKVDSLRQAQLDMIRGKTNSQLLAQRGVGGIGKLGQTLGARSSNAVPTSHPYFWAPFILVGDGK